MEQHTTNYFDTFIVVADDCPTSVGEVPPIKGDKSAANIQFDMMYNNPYKYTSDEILFRCFAIKQGLTAEEEKIAKEVFFSKGQACLRASPLTKRYGWGVHSNHEGKVALYGVETDEYKKLAKDISLKISKAMRSKKA